MFMFGNNSDEKPLHLPVEVHLDELVINIEGSSAKKGFCVGAWGLPVEHVFLLNPNKFPKDMTCERLILLCLRKKRPKNSRHTLVQVWLKGVPATGDWEDAPWLQQIFEIYFFWGTLYNICKFQVK